jgi:hypothetical protein
MRRISLILLVLVASVAYGQTFTYTPEVSTKGLASCITGVGSDTIAVAAKTLGSVEEGMRVYGVGIPYGATVTEKLVADSSVRISEYVTRGGTKTLWFGYYVTTTYGSGDWMGWPVKVFRNDRGGPVTLISASISDSTDGIGNTDVVFFQAFEDSSGADSLATVWPKGSTYKILGVISFTSATDLGTSRVLTLNNIGMTLPRSELYFRVLAKAAYGPTLITTPLRVHLNFLE